MHTITEIRSRDEMIECGQAIGRTFKANRLDRPWMVLMNGPINGGKSLIALAIDRALSPRRYLRGIGTHITVDERLMPHDIANEQSKPLSKAVFGNFRGRLCASRKSLGETLAEHSSSSPGAVVCIASNIKRIDNDSWAESFNYARRGLGSKHFDMHIDVRLRPGAFPGQIALTYEDPRLAPISADAAKAMLRLGRRKTRVGVEMTSPG